MSDCYFDAMRDAGTYAPKYWARGKTDEEILAELRRLLGNLLERTDLHPWVMAKALHYQMPEARTKFFTLLKSPNPPHWIIDMAKQAGVTVDDE